MAYFYGVDSDERTVLVREYRCGCVIASEFAPNQCPYHGEAVVCQSYATRKPDEKHVGWGGE